MLAAFGYPRIITNNESGGLSYEMANELTGYANSSEILLKTEAVLYFSISMVYGLVFAYLELFLSLRSYMLSSNGCESWNKIDVEKIWLSTFQVSIMVFISGTQEGY
jgi:hypothetical protein